MFGWRRKNDGFVWSDYVRTTIKIRREDRAKKIEEIKQAAAAGAIGAGRQSLSAGRGGIGALGRWLAGCARWFWAVLTGGARRAGSAFSAVSDGVKGAGRPRLSVARIPARMKIAAMFGGLGLLAGLSAYLQYEKSGSDWSAMLAGLVAVVLLGLATAPWLRRLGKGIVRTVGGFSLQGFGSNTSRRSWPAMPPLKWIGAAAAVVLAGGAGFWAWQSGGLSAASSSVKSIASSGVTLPEIKGRGRAVSGDTIRIGRRFVRLAGVEAPEISQVCGDKHKRSWQCGQRARSELARVIRRKTLVCAEVSRIEGGRYEANCRIGDRDIAGEVVEKGYAFAQGTIFKTYAAAEEKARAAQRGIWQGEVQRPADFRAKRWEVASKSAPDGCPIKGRVVRKSKVYVLPWALDYRRVRIRSKRGERWFCSESEAAAAGFRPSSTG